MVLDNQWKRASIEFTVENLFQIVFEVFKKDENIFSKNVDIIAIDNLTLTHGSCNLMASYRFLTKQFINIFEFNFGIIFETKLKLYFKRINDRKFYFNKSKYQSRLMGKRSIKNFDTPYAYMPNIYFQNNLPISKN